MNINIRKNKLYEIHEIIFLFIYISQAVYTIIVFKKVILDEYFKKV